jgi:hypothetical protein
VLVRLRRLAVCVLPVVDGGPAMNWHQLTLDDIHDHGTLERYRAGCGCPPCITAARTPALHPAKGVTWNKGRRCWAVNIQLRGRKIHLGYHPDARSAARAVDAADIALGRKPANGTNPSPDDIDAARIELGARGVVTT